MKDLGLLIILKIASCYHFVNFTMPEHQFASLKCLIWMQMFNLDATSI